jgi:hypothetical protein
MSLLSIGNAHTLMYGVKIFLQASVFTDHIRTARSIHPRKGDLWSPFFNTIPNKRQATFGRPYGKQGDVNAGGSIAQ